MTRSASTPAPDPRRRAPPAARRPGRSSSLAGALGVLGSAGAQTGTHALNVGPIAGDDIVHIAKNAAGFAISGSTGSEAGVSVRVTIGSQPPLTATSGDDGAWSVMVLADADYLIEPSVSVAVSATKAGFTSPSPVTRTVTVDLAAPSASYTVPGTLKVGVPVTDMMPSTPATDIDGYAATGLPSGLAIDAGTGDITGTPDTANDSSTTATVTVTDAAGNPADPSIAFPAVAKAEQTLVGFAYSPATVTFGDPAASPARFAGSGRPGGRWRRPRPPRPPLREGSFIHREPRTNPWIALERPGRIRTASFIRPHRDSA